METYTYEHFGIPMDIHYTREEGEAEVHTLPNGDPGTPGTDPTVTIHHIFITLKDKNKNDIDVDIYPIIDEFEIDMEHVDYEINEYYER
jgi:hypothetical protein|tara:strand:+ start:360 stop:626 length:267 start_codon:yes stop_codon:yes gene_type:complete